LTDEIKNFQGSFGQRRQEENLSLEMYTHEFFLKHALSPTATNSIKTSSVLLPG